MNDDQKANPTAQGPNEIQGRVLTLIQKTLEAPLPADEITADIGLLGRGIGLDSIEILALVSAIETEFDLTIDDSELEERHFATLGALADFVRRRLPA
jgi:acyl carrier protein